MIKVRAFYMLFKHLSLLNFFLHVFFTDIDNGDISEEASS